MENPNENKEFLNKLYSKISNGIDDDKQIKKNLFYIFCIAIAFIGLIFLIEILSIVIGNFIKIENGGEVSSMGVGDVVGILGPFGDFFGGILNPILTFCSFMALLMTIILQQKELSLTRKELSETQKATRDSARALEEQSNSIKIQNFENTFFNMLDLHNKIVDNIKISKEHTINYSYNLSNGKRFSKYSIVNLEEPERVNMIYGREAIDLICKNIETFKNDRFNSVHSKKVLDETLNRVRPFPIVYDLCHECYKKIIGHYFGNIYQILKFISESDNKIINKERYVNLFRSQFSSPELKILFYHCTGSIGSKKFKKLLEDFSFLEHLPIEKSNQHFKYILYKSIYKNSAFGIKNNQKFIEKELIIDEINKTLERQKTLGKIADIDFYYLSKEEISNHIEEYIKEIDRLKENTIDINKKAIKIHDFYLNVDKEKAESYLKMTTFEKLL